MLNAENVRRMEKIKNLFDHFEPELRDKVKNILLEKGTEIYTLLIKELPETAQTEIKRIMEKND